MSANGQPIKGGDRTANVEIKFTQVIDGIKQPELLGFDVCFSEADIEVDAILSYPWMSANRVGIFPHHRALTRDEPEFTLLYGKKNGRSREERLDQMSEGESRTNVDFQKRKRSHFQKRKSKA